MDISLLAKLAFFAILWIWIVDSSRPKKIPYKRSPEIEKRTPFKTIKFPETTTYTARLFASYPNNDVLTKAKKLVDKNYPFHGAPHGGTYYIARRREYVLNQYLWFYEKNKRFPRDDEQISELRNLPITRLPELVPASWFVLTDKTELKARKLLNQREHLWISLKKGSETDCKKLQLRCDKVDKQITELFNKHPDLLSNR